MRNHPLTGLITLTAILMIPAVGAFCFTTPMLGQPAGGQPDVKPLPGAPDSKYIGLGGCKGCHEQGDTNPGFRAQGTYDFCLMDETKTWSEKDMHALAYKALSTDLGKQMGDLLGTDVTKDVRCLTCHALDAYPEKPLNEKKLEAFETENGVSCEGCHGPGLDWITHFIPNRWRYLTASQKSEMGMADLRDPVVRTQKCAGCHVGNVAEGKFVTHEMYAVGHPPLPGLEILTFSEDMPRHWMLKSQTPVITDYADKEPDKVWDVFRYRKGENAQARLLAVGALVAFRSSMRSLALEAQQTKGIIDFANFDCYACHHDLEYPSWRQERGYGGGVPGRPTIRAWPVNMTQLVINHASGNDAVAKVGEDLEPALKALRGTIDARPFGDPEQVAVAANTLADWSDQVLKGLESYDYSPEETDRLVRMLIDAGKSVATDPAQGGIDYEAAQQLGCAFNVLTRGGERSQAMKDAIDQLGKVVLLQFREEGQRRFIAERIEPRLNQLYDFRPKDFRDAFSAIDSAFSK